jgi:putative solute:sodium symporter small subunit
MANPSQRKAYWRCNLRILSILLFVWFAASFGCSILLVDTLDEVSLFGFPVGFWMAQQGSIFIFTILIWIYVWWMDRLDRQHNVHEDDSQEYDI